MSSLRDIAAELAFLTAAGALLWFFPKTIITIQVVALAITLSLMQVERHFR